MSSEPLRSFIKTIESKNNEQRRARIIEELEGIGCRFTIQEYPFEASGETGHNVIVKLGNAEDKIVIGAHYDVAMGSGGANDNGSGVSVLLGFIRAYRGDLEHSVEVVFFDHEETPESGARVYVQHSENIGGMFNLDICGMGDTIVFDDKGRPGNPIVVAVKQAIESLQYRSKMMPELPASDEQRFEEGGIPNIQLAVIPNEDVELVTGLVAAQKDLRAAIRKGEITPREADEKIKEALGGSGLPKLLRVMHTPEDLSIHLSENTLRMVLDTVTASVERYDKMT